MRIALTPGLSKRLSLIRVGERVVATVSGGRRTLLDIAGVQNLGLTVPGRTSGTPYTFELACGRYGDGWVVAASNFAQHHEPQWAKNLRVADRVTARIRGRQVIVAVREIPQDEWPAAWAAMIAAWPPFVEYARRTPRQIALFALTPEPASEPG